MPNPNQQSKSPILIPNPNAESQSPISIPNPNAESQSLIPIPNPNSQCPIPIPQICKKPLRLLDSGILSSLHVTIDSTSHQLPSLQVTAHLSKSVIIELCFTLHSAHSPQDLNLLLWKRSSTPNANEPLPGWLGGCLLSKWPEEEDCAARVDSQRLSISNQSAGQPGLYCRYIAI